MPKRKRGDTTPPARPLSVSLPEDLRAYARLRWRAHQRLNGELADNISQYIADLIARDRAENDA